MLSHLSFLRSRQWQILTVLLLSQAAFYYLRAKSIEHVPIVRPLAAFPTNLGEWRMTEEGVIENEVREVLKADDLLSRFYVRPAGRSLSLFVAYFKSQRTGVAPHSPKNCLPGSGWEPSRSGVITIPVENGSRTIEANRYLVSRGEQQSLVVYWYQSHNRVVASEYSAKIHTVLDSMRYNRSDTAIVRVVSPVYDGAEETASREASAFIQAIFPELSRYFPE